MKKSFQQAADDERDDYGDEDNYNIHRDSAENQEEDFESSPATKYTDVNESIMHTEAKLSGDQRVSEKMREAERRFKSQNNNSDLQVEDIDEEQKEY